MRWKLGVAWAVGVVGVTAGLFACRESPLGPAASGAGPPPSLSVEDCWPPSTQCQERALTPGEELDVRNQINLIKTNDLDCLRIKGEAQSHIDAPGGSTIRMQTSPPYFPGQTGDRHNEPGITHIVEESYLTGDSEALQRNVIHETAHALGYGHPEAYTLENRCLGQPQ